MLWSTSGSDSSISNEDSIRNLVREGSGSLLEPSSSFLWVSNQRTMKEMLQSTPGAFSLSRSMNASTNLQKQLPRFIQTLPAGDACKGHHMRQDSEEIRAGRGSAEWGGGGPGGGPFPPLYEYPPGKILGRGKKLVN